MANTKVSELTAITNIQDGDLVEITKYMGAGLGDGGGDYKSYKMTWAALKAFFKYDEIVKIELEGGIASEYFPARYELVKAFAYIQSVNTSQTILIQQGVPPYESILPATNATAGNLDLFCTQSNEDDRTLYIEASEDGFIFLFVTKNLIP